MKLNDPKNSAARIVTETPPHAFSGRAENRLQLGVAQNNQRMNSSSLFVSFVIAEARP
jgi:hypothetical protein